MTISALFSSGVALVCVLFQRGILGLFFGAVEPDVMDAALPLSTTAFAALEDTGYSDVALALKRSFGPPSKS